MIDTLKRLEHFGIKTRSGPPLVATLYRPNDHLTGFEIRTVRQKVPCSYCLGRGWMLRPCSGIRNPAKKIRCPGCAERYPRQVDYVDIEVPKKVHGIVRKVIIDTTNPNYVPNWDDGAAAGYRVSYIVSTGNFTNRNDRVVREKHTERYWDLKDLGRRLRAEFKASNDKVVAEYMTAMKLGPVKRKKK